MAARGFSKPKVYDPGLAERQGTSTSLSAFAGASKVQQLMDLGFDDEANIFQGEAAATATALGGAGAGANNGGNGAASAGDDRCRELREQLEEARKAQQASKESEAKTTQKLQSFQQVNRSQTALVRAELQKTRRRLAHMQAVAQRLRQQAEWLQGQSPALALPVTLQGLPSEDEACEGEGAEIAQLQQRWENDIVQMQAVLLGEAGQRGGNAVSRSPSPPSSELEEARERIQKLEAALKKQHHELQKLRAEGGQPAGSPSAAGAAASNGEEAASLRKELEASEEKAKETQKKLKQLATAYKKVEQEKADSAARLKETERALDAARAEAAKPKAPERAAVSPALLNKVRETLLASRAQLNTLRAEVTQDLQTQIPAVLQQTLNGKLPELQGLVDGGAREWKEKYAIECDKRRKLHNLVQELKGNIRVYCRVRPLNERESGSCISFPAQGEIQIRNEETGAKKAWQFNEVYRENSTQQMLFDGIRDLVVSMLDGYNVCIFAYGQTGAGKTHSMQGTKDNPGIYTRTFNELFKVAQERKGWKIELRGALVEVYNEEIRDLLADPNKKPREKLQVKQGKEGNYVPGLTLQPVATPDEVETLLATGSGNRTVAATDMNLHSSRSHLLVQILGSMTSPEGKKTSSAITLVDLAGSERLAKSGVSGDRAKEAIAINKSLAALGDVINARASKNAHTPFRNSTLTHLLQDSLSGDSKTLMLLQINPCKDHVEESMCSLQFGARVNNVEMSKK